MANHNKRQRQGSRQGTDAVLQKANFYGPLDAKELGERWYVQVPVSYTYTQWLVSELAPNLWDIAGVAVKKCIGHQEFERGSVVFLTLDAPSCTELHKDPVNTLLLMVAGKRTVWVAAPHKYTVDRGGYSVQGVSALPENLNPASPSFDSTWMGLEPVVLNAGDAILFPKNWWHVVQGEVGSVALGIELVNTTEPIQKTIRNVGKTRSPLGWTSAARTLRIMAVQQLVFPAELPKLVARVQTRSAGSLIVVE